jgi:quinol monooxygenase YgiN
MSVFRQELTLVGLMVLFLAALGLPLEAESPVPGVPLFPLVIITHVDVVPQFTAPGIKLLWRYREDSLKDEGAQRIDVLQQIGRPNHFTLVEQWASQQAYDKHVSAPHTRQFRADLAPMLGAPFDERPHSVVKSELGSS